MGISHSPTELRTELERLIINDLLGPAGGPEEELDGGEFVRDRYLVGALAPRGSIALDRERLDPDGVDANDAQSDLPDSEANSAQSSLFPSSFGLSFVVAGDTHSLAVDVSWGNYERVQRDSVIGETSGSRSIWRRRPIAGHIEVPLAEGNLTPLAPVEEFPDVTVRGQASLLRGHWLVTLFLVNGQSTPEKLRDRAWMFQSKISVSSGDGQPVFLARSEVLGASATTSEHERAHLDLLYRDELEFAIGHGIATTAIRSEIAHRRADRIETAALPTYEVLRTEAPSAEDRPDLESLVLDMKALSEGDVAEVAEAVRPLADAYSAWLDAQEARISTDPDLAEHVVAAHAAVTDGRAAARRLQSAIDLLAADEQVANAFRFANRAMWLQRVHTEAAKLRREHTALDLDAALTEVDVPAKRSWRPFQLAFVLLNLPSLADPTHEERREPGLADLLFFPTGGGKTEAYLGLTAFTLGIRRLQGILGGRDGGDGVAVLMRYTLRLLTAQQFQRASALICACEVIRRTDQDRWGLAPFRIGMWVGASVTPTRTATAARALDDAHGTGGRGSGRVSSPVQLVSCPWCGSSIDPGRDAQTDTDRWRTLVYCGDPMGQCEFSPHKSPREGLPVLTVDEEICRLLPSLVIATADKFALLPWQGQLHVLFGSVERRCERHGYRTADLDHVGTHVEADTHRAQGGLPAAQTISVTALRPPDLIIQDELHLIAGPLGTMVGLYETAIDKLASWEVDGIAVRPKLVASTATIRRAADQVHAVFWRHTAIFPPPVLDLDDSFFAVRRQVIDAPGRRYVGICARGWRMKSVEVRIFSTVLSAAQKLFDQFGEAADPWMTLIGYFNALRELGGMRRLLDDEVNSRVRRGDRRGLGNRTYLNVTELTSRVGSTDIPKILDELAIRHFPVPAGQRREGPAPTDVVLATNMISVGVDVSRLGLMTVVGQPKGSAEYIQATSRVGRETWAPGLVLTIYNWARPRDLSHFETFEQYHATFYRHVEALSVTPFAVRALDRGLSAVFAALVRHETVEWNPEPAARTVTLADARVTAIIDAIARRGESVAARADVGEVIRDMARHRRGVWGGRQTKPGVLLSYSVDRDTSKPLLEHPTGASWEVWTAPMSLRDVEPNVNLIIDERDDSVAVERGWQAGPDEPALTPIDEDTVEDELVEEPTDGRS